jgi:hypothetical protein
MAAAKAQGFARFDDIAGTKDVLRYAWGQNKQAGDNPTIFYGY